MRLERKSCFDLLEPLLAQVEHPVRYLDHEWGAHLEQEGPFHVCMCYADTYEVGQPNLGIAILYNALNAAQGISCERVFLPWKDMEALMRERGVPLLSLETSSPLASFDVVGFTLAHELIATNVLETLDLAGIPIVSAERAEDDPFIIAGGPSVWNCEPLSPVFDAVLLGDGEEHIVDVCSCIRDARERGLSRQAILRSLAQVQGTYVPSLYEVVVDDTSTRWGYAVPLEGTGAPPVVYKRCIAHLSDFDAFSQHIVPYMGVVQDRMALEVLRGCARGCRFCQAGMTYRPVRERPHDTVVEACERGLLTTGYAEVSLSSLSTTDHSHCAEMVRALNERFAQSGVRISIPSQRLDSFGIDMAAATSEGRRSGLTFAPEAGSQRLRNVINKNVTAENIESASRNAFEAGWRRCKLYFMLGLPTETDDDIVAIDRVAERVLEIGRETVGKGVKSGVNVSTSVAVFVPKAHTPFQWFGQVRPDEVVRRQQLLLANALPDRSYKISYHDSRASLVEGALSRMGRQGFALIKGAWERGAKFDAWTSEFALDAWERAAREELGTTLEDIACESFDLDARLPWEHTSPGVSKGFLLREWRRAMEGITTSDCTFTSCVGCGVCPTLGVSNDLEGVRS